MNILDTPGHEDFAEDTYRTLTAVDSVIIVIDGAKGVETQTRKLMNVCRMRKTPVMVFVNKLDRPCRDPFDLLDEIETELKIAVRPLSFPVSSGPAFKGVYNIYDGSFSAFTSNDRQTVSEAVKLSLDSPQLDEYIRPYTGNCATTCRWWRGCMNLSNGNSIWPANSHRSFSGVPSTTSG